MKNKVLNYVLIIASVVLWGTIIYRVYEAYGKNDEETPVFQPASLKTAYNDYSETKDTTRLLLNYPDPFRQSRKAVKDTVTAVRLKPATSVINKPVPVSVNWSFIRYSGFIRNQGSQKLVALMILNGKSISMQEGESADQVKLLKNMRDSVKISYHGQTKFISIDRSTP